MLVGAEAWGHLLQAQAPRHENGEGGDGNPWDSCLAARTSYVPGARRGLGQRKLAYCKTLAVV